MSSEEYFLIEEEHLGKEKIFPFHLYIYNPTGKKHSAFLYANSPLDFEKESFMKFILEKGGSLAVSMKQKRTFLRAVDKKEDDIPSLKKETPNEEEKRREERTKELEAKSKTLDGKFHFNNELKSSLASDNYMRIIDRAREEILCFSIKINHTVSLASFLADKLMNEDNWVNRVVAVSYFLAKINKYDAQTALGDLIVAGYFYHLGLTQLDRSLANLPFTEMIPDSQNRYMKHPGLTQHLLRKSDVDLTERCIKVILDHHERTDGSGYPARKVESGIDPLALILGLVAHIFEFSNGQINGSKKPIDLVVNNIANKNFNPGLELEFGDKITEGLKTLLKGDGPEK